MDRPQQRRDPRIALEEGCPVQFNLDGALLAGMPLVSLGAGGCCVELPSALRAALAPGTRLKWLVFEHEDLALPPVEAEVVHLMGLAAAEEHGHFYAGVRFLDATPEFRRRIQAFVVARLPHLRSAAG